ncbi:hypothetical protein [uncultured Methanobrevibacter sp.]|uniref:hypothetical protein n=1 Tax=uncultured Methanobrevibacter sp. TaxID=253161 RepID=UPI0025D1F933|nr:hypothetical protein [uncultured Methanobrevibacter sp.]
MLFIVCKAVETSKHYSTRQDIPKKIPLTNTSIRVKYIIKMSKSKIIAEMIIAKIGILNPI